MKCPDVVKLAKKQELANLLNHPTFQLSGSTMPCMMVEPDIFFEDSPEAIQAAKTVCASCPLLRECAEWGLAFEDYGVWGGTTPKERYLQRGGKDATDPEYVKAIRSELQFILRASTPQVAQRYDVNDRTVVRWRKVLKTCKAVA